MSAKKVGVIAGAFNPITRAHIALAEAARAHVYEAVQPAEKTKRQLVSDLVQRAFGGSASQLVMHALSGKNASPDEIDEIRRILDEHAQEFDLAIVEAGMAGPKRPQDSVFPGTTRRLRRS